MRRIQYRQWCPDQSPLRIEVAENLLRELRPKPGTLETQGVLYGQRHQEEIRLLSAEPRPGLTALGIFVCRERGEVFLTESNLESIEQRQALLALVVAGNRAGFFVHAADGTIQTVRSHEEFSIVEPPKPASLPKPPPASLRKWNWAVAGWLALAALPVAALAYLRPAFPQKIPTTALDVREVDGQLLIYWKSGEAAILEIQDGLDHTSIPVFPDQSRATYLRRSGEVEISLVRLEHRGARRESTRFLGAAPASRRDQLYSDIVHIRAQADELRAESAAHRKKIAALEKKIAERVEP